MPNQSGPTTEAGRPLPALLPALRRRAYRANLREMERLQRLQIVQEVYFGDSNKIGELHDLQLYQRVAKRNQPPKPTVDNLDEYLAARVANDPELAEILRKQHEARQQK